MQARTRGATTGAAGAAVRTAGTALDFLLVVRGVTMWAACDLSLLHAGRTGCSATRPSPGMQAAAATLAGIPAGAGAVEGAAPAAGRKGRTQPPRTQKGPYWDRTW